MDDKPLDLSKKTPIESVEEAEPLSPSIHVSSHGELSKPVEKRIWATKQESLKPVHSHQINRENEAEKLEEAGKDEKQMKFVDRFSSYTYGRSGQIQEGENNLEPNSLKSKQVCTDIRVSIIKSQIKHERNVVKDERTARHGPSSNSGAQSHRDGDFSIFRQIQDDHKITVHQKCVANERRDYMSNEPSISFFSSLACPAKTFYPPGESSQSLESGRKATKEESMKSIYAHKLSKENETLVSGDVILGSYVMIKKKTSKVPATNSRTKRHKSLDSASDVKHKSKPRIFDDQGCRQRATARCSCSRPSTSACCSYDSPVIQGHPMNSDQELLCEHCRHSNNVEKHSTCEQCTKRLSRSDGLQVRMDTEEQPFVCKKCEKTFTTSKKLLLHSRIHTEDRRYKCKTCGKAFYQKCNLEMHNRTHTGEKPYKCEECGKTFSLSYSLKMHNRIHTGEKPYICAICGKGFKQKHHMKRHESTHKDKTKEE
ncbi:Zinc finger protein with KRAB and SCAN domains 4 [Araneus ventricosus]|uniref:Zinc finger protein with KRAB and SCAN domains 4 n=1 Tax=Araneus ventricosus TaxID=182803 RepID=A0A4Y2G9N2_ARAVE|nr:Zinc finger protein with KRAB and SCAN domains 4 [Araneus ventricosus]